MNYKALDYLPDGVIVLDSKKRVLYHNTNAKPLADTLQKNFRKGAKIQNILNLSKTPGEVSYTDITDKPIKLRITVRTLSGRGKDKWMVFLKDVTLDQYLYAQSRVETSKKERMIKESQINELRETRDQLLQHGKTAIIGQFIASITHELNNPLTYLMSSTDSLLQLFEDEVFDYNRAKKLAENVTKGANKIFQLSSHLKKFLHGPLSTENLILSDLHSIVEGAIAFTRHFTEKNNVSVINNVPLCLPHTLLDPTLIEQIAINLVRNSVEAMIDANMTSKTTIEINARYIDRSDCLALSFTDHGPGISSDAMKKLFTPFFTTKGLGKGTGLGLNICASIAEKHGGTLTARSEPGKGATFVLTLPIRNQKTDVYTDPLRANPWGESLKGLKVLLVDDEPQIRSLQRSFLSQLGCEIFEAGNGVEALEKCREAHPDVTITDLAMDEMTGLEFAVRAKELYQNMKIILLTGSVALQNLDSRKALFDELITKPFPTDTIRKAIVNVMHPGEPHPFT